jgi:hypothetical protein
MAGSAVSLVWTIPPDKLAGNIGDYAERLLLAVFDLAQLFAAKIESYAKLHAVWTDRTSNARQGLTARAFKEATAVTLLLFHTVEYGIWLEVANAGRYAIILRSLEAHYSVYMSAIERLIR